MVAEVKDERVLEKAVLLQLRDRVTHDPVDDGGSRNRCQGNHFIGAPPADAEVRAGDRLTLYGRTPRIAELDRRVAEREIPMTKKEEWHDPE